MDGEQRAWSGSKAVAAFGLLTVAFWIFPAVLQPIPPLVPFPDLGPMLGGVAPWIRKMAPGLDRPDSEVLASLRRELLWAYAEAWLKNGSGVLAGILIARRKPAGRWIAIILSGVVLAQFLVGQARLASGGHLTDFWSVLAHRDVGTLIRRVVELLFLLGTLLYLTRRLVRQQFARAAPDSPR